MKSLQQYIKESSDDLSGDMASRQRFYTNRMRESRNNRSDIMGKVFNAPYNTCSPMIVEHITLDRIINLHGSNGFIAISACKGDNTQEENLQRTAELKAQISREGYSYLPTYGGYRNQETGEEGDYEPSFIVFNYSKDGVKRDFVELFNLAIKWCDEYNQDVVMIKSPDDIARYYNREGIEDKSFHASVGIFKNDPKQEYFTSLKSPEEVNHEIDHKLWVQYKKELPKGKKPDIEEFKQWKSLPENREKVKSIGRRWTNNIQYVGECYVNPVPMNLGEMRKRTGSGEIMVFV